MDDRAMIERTKERFVIDYDDPVRSPARMVDVDELAYRLGHDIRARRWGHGDGPATVYRYVPGNPSRLELLRLTCLVPERIDEDGSAQSVWEAIGPDGTAWATIRVAIDAESSSGKALEHSLIGAAEGPLEELLTLFTAATYWFQLACRDPSVGSTGIASALSGMFRGQAESAGAKASQLDASEQTAIVTAFWNKTRPPAAGASFAAFAAAHRDRWEAHAQAAPPETREIAHDLGAKESQG